MRLWTLHPKYLDARGLVALWREALLAQAVVRGRTRGYISHPQLIRFREAASPLASVARYLQVIQAEAMARGYHFDAAKIGAVAHAEPIVVTRGQLDYEWSHLKEKLKTRAPLSVARLERISYPEPHPLFRIVPGPVAEWEVSRRKETRTRGAGK
jgi:hypothetical protein